MESAESRGNSQPDAQASQGRRDLEDLDFQALKKHWTSSQTIKTLGILWCIGTATWGLLAAVLLVVSVHNVFTGELERDIGDFLVLLAMAVGTLLWASLNAATAYGLLVRPKWGLFVGKLASVFFLPFVPIGTAVGILGLVALKRGRRLFGDEKISHDRLKAEINHRTENKVSR